MQTFLIILGIALVAGAVWFFRRRIIAAVDRREIRVATWAHEKIALSEQRLALMFHNLEARVNELEGKKPN